MLRLDRLLVTTTVVFILGLSSSHAFVPSSSHIPPRTLSLSKVTPFDYSRRNNGIVVQSLRSLDDRNLREKVGNVPAVKSSVNRSGNLFLKWNRQAVFKVISRILLSISLLAVATSSFSPYAQAKTVAATVAPVEHLHIGQKIANYLRSFNLPDVAVLAIISALPVVELRGGVPVGLWMGLPLTTVLPACVLGNMAPIIPLLFLLRNERLKNLMSPILNRAEKKSASLGVGSVEKQWASLAAFVGIPLPGTGAWTGAMGAFLLGMPTAVALSSIFTGVVSAGIIVSAITMAGKKGGLAALAVLAVFTGKEFFSGTKKQD